MSRRPGAPETVPLSARVQAMMLFRLVVAGALLGLAGLTGVLRVTLDVPVTLTYLGLTAGLSALVLTRNRGLAVRAFGVGLLVDSGWLVVQQHRFGQALGVQLAVAAFLVSVCLLASFRTGLKVALWYSLLRLLHVQAARAGLLHGAAAGSQGDQFWTQLIWVWVLVLTTSSFAAINERELRRRRYDAEAMQRFASCLHRADQVEQVAELLLDYVVQELDAARGLILRRQDGALDVIAGAALAPRPATASALLDACSRSAAPVLAGRLDPAADPDLDALLPQAARLVAVRLEAGEQGGTFLVFEQGRGRGVRLERRVLTTAAQAAATTALAWSRAELLDRARRAAAVDALTGVANRRSLDAALADLDARPRAGYAVVMVDVDRFKQVNDVHGHQAGDQVLQVVAAALAAAADPPVFLARFGGEEFALLCPGLDAAAAVALAERARQLVAAARGPVPVTASFGVAATGAGPGEDAAGLLARADAALLRAKQTGRDRVVLDLQAGPPPAAGAGPLPHPRGPAGRGAHRVDPADVG